MIVIDIQKKLQGSGGRLDLACNLTIEAASFTALYGISGAGKTTLLRMIAGLETPDSGTIIVEGEVWFDSDKKIDLPPQKRKIGYVFQEYALFPNMTVIENLRFSGADEKTVNELMHLSEIEPLKDRYPHTLSGGQKQRVALARALALKPKILLLDEPLSALDRKIRSKLQVALSRLHQHFNMTSILVSHDLSEIFKLCQRVVTLEEGKIVLQGTPQELFIQKKQSSKFAFSGEILSIVKHDIVYIAVVDLGHTLTQVVLSSQDIENLKVGDTVLIATKAFNPIVKRIDA